MADIKLYLDLDDVLADFEGAVLERGFTNNKELVAKGDSNWTPEERQQALEIRKLFDEEEFWYNLKPFEDTRWFFEKVRRFDPYILTARPGRHIDEGRIETEKREWVRKYLPEIDDEHFYCVLRSEKPLFASGVTDILIDDSLQNIEEWINAKGYGIYHQENLYESHSQFLEVKDSIEEYEYLKKIEQIRKSNQGL